MKYGAKAWRGPRLRRATNRGTSEFPVKMLHGNLQLPGAFLSTGCLLSADFVEPHFVALGVRLCPS
jgi:hypothetical protein